MLYIIDNGERYEDNAVAFVRVADDLVRAYPEIVQVVSAGESGNGKLICNFREEHVEWATPRLETTIVADWTTYVSWIWFARWYRSHAFVPAPEAADVLGVRTTFDGTSETLYRAAERPALPAGALTVLLAAWRSRHDASRAGYESKPNPQAHIHAMCLRSLATDKWILDALDAAHAAGRLVK